MKHKITIVETYKRVVEIEAESKDEAYEIAQDMVSNGDIDLPCDGGNYDYTNEFY